MVDRGYAGLRICLEQRLARGRHLGLADGGVVVHDLPLQVGRFDPIVIDDDEVAHAGARQVDGGGRAQAAHADDERRPGDQGFLTGNVDLRQHDLTAVPEQLIVGQPRQGLRPLVTRSSPARSRKVFT